jgi:hypothetical protein
MKKIKIIASEPLFNKWKEIGKRIRNVANFMDDAASIVQNNMELELEDLLRWKDKVIPSIIEELDKRKDEVNKLAEITRNYIKGCQ